MATAHMGVKRLGAPLEAIMVDGFSFECAAVRHWFLTHAHSDHTVGLRSSFDKGTIYCSSITKRLVCARMGGLDHRMVTIEAGGSLELEGEGIRVEAVDAGHCPGSLMFVFEKRGYRCLHTGDCRASKATIARLAAYHRATTKTPLDCVYLDTTYAGKGWEFPSQEDACALAEAVARRAVAEEPRTLIVCPAYSIGKENAIEAVCRGSGGKAWVSSSRASHLKLCERWDDAVYTINADDPQVNVVVESMLGGSGPKKNNESPPERLRRMYLLSEDKKKYEKVVQIRCTGWEFKRARLNNGVYEPKPWIDGDVALYGVPYSEHSSFPELRQLIGALRPRNLVPTVGADTRADRQALRALFADLLDAPHTIDYFFSSAKRTTTHPVAELRALLPSLSREAARRLLAAHGGAVDKAAAAYLDAGAVIDLTRADREDQDDAEPFLGRVFDVVGADKDFKLFKAAGRTAATTTGVKRRQQPGGPADVIRKKLKALGAVVVERTARGEKKLAPTDVLAPEGTEPGLLAVAEGVRVRCESWLVGKSRALKSGHIRPPSPAQIRQAAAQTIRQKPTKKEPDVCSVTGRKRKGPRRTETAETRALLERALGERMYLLDCRDETPWALCRVPRKLVFGVLGSTGNAYTVVWTTEPSCDCPHAAKRPGQVCKHRLFVGAKVLGLTATAFSHVPYQRYLLYDELEECFQRATHISGGHLASTAARAAYASSSTADGRVLLRPDRDDDDVDDDEARKATPRMNLNTCAVCFEDVSKETGFDSCPCGRRFHSDCLEKWFAHAPDPVCPTCRAPWRASQQQCTPTHEEGFLNLRALQPGVPSRRDVSAYATDRRGRPWLDVHAERRQTDQALRPSRSSHDTSPSAAHPAPSLRTAPAPPPTSTPSS